MARDSDSFGDGTRPFDASFGDATSSGAVERDATGFLGDDSVRLDQFGGPSLDSTAYAMPVGDPFNDALAEGLPEWSDSARVQRTPASSDEDPTRDGQSPEPPTQETPAQPPAPVQPPVPVRQPQRQPAPPRPRNQPNRSVPPANRRAAPPGQPTRRPAPNQPPSRRSAPNQPPPRRPAPTQPAPPRTAPNQSATRRQASPPPAARQGAKSAYPLTLDDLTKRPPIGRQQPARRPKAGPRRTNSMARFPTGPVDRAAPPAEQVAPARRARNVRPIVPIVLFVVILVGLIRGCANARDKSDAPQRDTVYSLTR